MDKEELKQRTKQFAHRIIKPVRALPQTVDGRVIGSQLLDLGTSTASNYRAVCRNRSTKEFVAKLGTVIEKAGESAF